MEVSIRARQLRRANLGVDPTLRLKRLVSIRARQLRRANRGLQTAIAIAQGFNPRPPITTGESQAQTQHPHR